MNNTIINHPDRAPDQRTVYDKIRDALHDERFRFGAILVVMGLATATALLGKVWNDRRIANANWAAAAIRATRMEKALNAVSREFHPAIPPHWTVPPQEGLARNDAVGYVAKNVYIDPNYGPAKEDFTNHGDKDGMELSRTVGTSEVRSEDGIDEQAFTRNDRQLAKLIDKLTVEFHLYGDALSVAQHVQLALRQQAEGRHWLEPHEPDKGKICYMWDYGDEAWEEGSNEICHDRKWTLTHYAGFIDVRLNDGQNLNGVSGYKAAQVHLIPYMRALRISAETARLRDVPTHELK